jgi:iron complex outermembrane receptor protein
VYQLYSATLNFRSDLFDVTSITAYSSLNNYSNSDISNSFGPAAFFVFGVPGPTASASILEKSSKFSQEVRLSSPNASHTQFDWQLGAFYTSENSAPNVGLFYANDPMTGAPLGLLYSYPFAANYDEYAAFGDVTYHFTDRLIPKWVREKATTDSILIRTSPAYSKAGSPFSASTPTTTRLLTW